MKLKLLIIFLAIAMERAWAARFDRSTGGETVKIERAPFMVAISRYCEITCSGALITIKHVITAAHCVVDDNLKPFRPLDVIIGARETMKSGTCHQVKRFTLNRYYDPAGLQNDVAIITLKGVITVNEVQRPIPLSIDPPPLGQFAALYTYRTDNISDSTCINTLLLKLYNTSECMTTDENLHFQFCGKSIRRSATVGESDSGSPLVHDGTLIGILSWAYESISGKAFLMNINHYLHFIRCVIRPETSEIAP